MSDTLAHSPLTNVDWAQLIHGFELSDAVLQVFLNRGALNSVPLSCHPRGLNHHMASIRAQPLMSIMLCTRPLFTSTPGMTPEEAARDGATMAAAAKRAAHDSMFSGEGRGLPGLHVVDCSLIVHACTPAHTA